MQKTLKKALVILLILAIALVIYYLSYSAYGAFNRFDIEILDGDFASADNVYSLSIRSERVILSQKDEKSMVYQIKIVDKNLAILTSTDTQEYCQFIDNGNTIYIMSKRVYLYKLEADNGID